MIPVATSPTSWGVDYADALNNPSWEAVLDGIAAAGYRWLELGPVGYLPEDGGKLSDEFAARGLKPVGTFIFERLHEPSHLDDVLETARRTTNLIQAVGGRHLVIVPHPHPSRAAVAGNSAAAPRLERDDWVSFLAAIETVARVADDRGIQAVVHPHAGTFLEYEDEIDAALEGLDPALVGLCVDSGHALYAGIDPAQLVVRYADRIQHVHLKDLNASVRNRSLSFEEAIGAGVFCPLGTGSVDLERFANTLKEIGYSGVATVEQDRDPTNPGDPVRDAASSLEYLRHIGFASDTEGSRA